MGALLLLFLPQGQCYKAALAPWISMRRTALAASAALLTALLLGAGVEQKDCEEGGRSRKRCATHGYPGGQCSFVALSLRRK